MDMRNISLDFDPSELDDENYSYLREELELARSRMIRHQDWVRTETIGYVEAVEQGTVVDYVTKCVFRYFSQFPNELPGSDKGQEEEAYLTHVFKDFAQDMLEFWAEKLVDDDISAAKIMEALSVPNRLVEDPVGQPLTHGLQLWKDSINAAALHQALQPIADDFGKTDSLGNVVEQLNQDIDLEVACAAMDTHCDCYYAVLKGGCCGGFVSRRATIQSLVNGTRYGREVKVLGNLLDAILCVLERAEELYTAANPEISGSCPWSTPQMVPPPKGQVDNGTMGFEPLFSHEDEHPVNLEDVYHIEFGYWLG
ncbi:hypothetical protein C8J56DRAFT_1061492 [Mycena floridula]|nr:hypothetical protein C8J56DRAFT_1061492 [Mycena floridula]